VFSLHGQIINDCYALMDCEGIVRDLIKVLPRKYPGVTELNHQKHQNNGCHGRDSNRKPYETESTVLPQHQPFVAS
jgi:hypothetical protein